jgi:tetratricopeptide (TPR) repeat protein
MKDLRVNYAVSGLQQRKSDVLLWSLCGSAYSHLSMYQEADYMYERAFNIDPDDSRTLFGMAVNCSQWADNYQQWADYYQGDILYAPDELKQSAADMLVSAQRLAPEDNAVHSLLEKLEDDGFVGNEDGYKCDDPALNLIAMGGFSVEEPVATENYSGPQTGEKGP